MRLEKRSARLVVGAAALAFCLLPAATAAASPPHAQPPARAAVVTDAGPLRGLVAAGMHEYLGIPYARPPVGPLRWRAPQPAARWEGIRDATAFAPHCPQIGGLFGEGSLSEDCLYLNVYTPETAAGKPPLPVMVWIHGGALITGESDDYDPAALVARGLVVVTINYRLGLLGFLAHPALEENGASGDYGLMDQQAALGWVQRNIDRFGGDPGNVTIFGESAGGLSVRSQLVSPAAAGLFHRALVESGAYTETLPSRAAAEATGESRATMLGCSDQSAECLRRVPVQALLDVEAATTASQLPNVRADVLPLDYAAAFASGAINRVPVLSGSNHDEWGLFVALYGDLSGHPVTPATYQAQIQAQLGVDPATAAGLAAFYAPAQFGGSAALALRALGTDAAFACNARTDVRNLSQYVPTYQYDFNDASAPNVFFPGFPLSFPLGAYHGSEIQYLFPTAASALDAEQQQLAGAMQGYWTNFAKTGDPNGDGLPSWPAYTRAGDVAMSLVPPSPVTETTFSLQHRCFFWAPGS